QITRGRTVLARLALPGPANPLTIGHTGGDPHRQGPAARADPLTATLGARSVDVLTSSPTLRARLAERERALVPRDQTSSLTRVARADPRPGLGTPAAAGRTCRWAGQPQRDFGAAH